MMNPTPGRELYFVEETVGAEDFPVESLDRALRRARLAAGRAVFVAWIVGEPHRLIATWTGVELKVGDGAEADELEVIERIGAEPVPAQFRRGVRFITIGGTARGMASELRGGVTL